MLHKDFGKALFCSRINIVKDNVTIRGQPNRESEPFSDRTKCGPPFALRSILDPALFDPKRTKQFPISLFVPAEYIAHGIPVNFFGRFNRDVQLLDNFFSEPVDSALVDEILQTGSLAIGSV